MDKFKSAFILLLWLSLVSCASFTHDRTLYQDLGGQIGVAKLVDSFINNIGHDEQIFDYFSDANVSRFRNQFIVHICAVSDGPCNYTGDSMEDIHAGMNINEADFNRVVELLIDAMEDQQITFKIQNRLLARLAPMRSGIIHR